MKVHLRILTSFFELIKRKDAQQEIVDYISSRIDEIDRNKAEKREQEGKKAKKPSKEEIEKMSRSIFWNMARRK